MANIEVVEVCRVLEGMVGLGGNGRKFCCLGLFDSVLLGGIGILPLLIVPPLSDARIGLLPGIAGPTTSLTVLVRLRMQKDL